MSFSCHTSWISHLQPIILPSLMLNLWIEEDLIYTSIHVKRLGLVVPVAVAKASLAGGFPQ